jgi:hypothetical protein
LRRRKILGKLNAKLGEEGFEPDGQGAEDPAGPGGDAADAAKPDGQGDEHDEDGEDSLVLGVLWAICRTLFAVSCFRLLHRRGRSRHKDIDSV